MLIFPSGIQAFLTVVIPGLLARQSFWRDPESSDSCPTEGLQKDHANMDWLTGLILFSILLHKVT
jgi:hypothetical protein